MAHEMYGIKCYALARKVALSELVGEEGVDVGRRREKLAVIAFSHISHDNAMTQKWFRDRIVAANDF